MNGAASVLKSDSDFRGQIDIQKIKTLYTIPLKKPDLEKIVLPQGALQNNNLLQLWSARFFLKKFFLLAENIFYVLEKSYQQVKLLSIIERLIALPWEKISFIIRRPEWTSLILIGERFSQTQNAQKLQGLFVYLEKFLSSVTHENNDNNVLSIFSPFQVNYLLDSHTKSSFGYSEKEVLASWYKEFFPINQFAPAALLYNLDKRQEHLWMQSFQKAYNILREFWPEAYSEFSETLFYILPVKSNGLIPFNYSVHDFRGLILSGTRPSYMLSQTMVHEAGHNKFSTILDLYVLFKNKKDELFYSAFVDNQRPMDSMLHGIFAFLQELPLCAAMIGNVEEISKGSIERYFIKIKALVQNALTQVNIHARLTEDGEKLVNTFNKIYADYA